MGHLLASLQASLQLQLDHVQEAQVEDVSPTVRELLGRPLGSMTVPLARENPLEVASDGLGYEVAAFSGRIQLEQQRKSRTNDTANKNISTS